MAPLAAAASSVTVRGKPSSARKLAHAHHLPGGATSNMTFSLRSKGGAVTTAFAVSATHYYEDFDLGGYRRVTRSEVFRFFKSKSGRRWCPKAGFRYQTVREDGRLAKVLSTVRFTVIAE